MAQQDAGLDMLHDIVVRQKGMGQQIFREVSSIVNISKLNWVEKYYSSNGR